MQAIPGLQSRSDLWQSPAKSLLNPKCMRIYNTQVWVSSYELWRYRSGGAQSVGGKRRRGKKYEVRIIPAITGARPLDLKQAWWSSMNDVVVSVWSFYLRHRPPTSIYTPHLFSYYLWSTAVTTTDDEKDEVRYFGWFMSCVTVSSSAVSAHNNNGNILLFSFLF